MSKDIVGKGHRSEWDILRNVNDHQVNGASKKRHALFLYRSGEQHFFSLTPSFFLGLFCFPLSLIREGRITLSINLPTYFTGDLVCE
jgi:hypothetical protein